MIDRETTNRILETANIVDVVSEFVTLRKAGSSYKGLCPFHNERTPSFSVSPSRNLCHCFSCGKGGSPVGFIMEHEQMTYPEALRWLAQKYHIEIKEREMSDEDRKEQSQRESMFIINEWAAQHYQDILKHHPDGIAIGMQYFRSRGFRDDIIEKFRLGFSLPDRHETARTARQKGYNTDLLVATGVCYEGKEPSDRFCGRAIFPWVSMSGKVVAFGGRVLDARTKGVNQKYVNSPESLIYHKDHELYGIFQAKKQIAKEDRVFMVEGYTDVLAMHQCGIENVVANSGTALSNHQVRMLHRFTNNIVFLYDGDAAGIKAALRGTDMILREGMNIKVLILPDGDDPDSFSRKHSAEDFRQYVEDHQTDFIQFKTDVLLNGVTDPVKRSEAINSIVYSISVIPDTILRATYIQICSQRLHVPEATLLSTMNAFIREDRKKTANGQQSSATTPGAPEGTSPVTDAVAVEASPSSTSTSVGVQAAVNHSSNIKSSPVEQMLTQVIVRHGDEDLYEAETEDGQTVMLTVAEFIYYNLQEDGIGFANPLYRRILAEAVEQSHTEGFVATTHFQMHPEIDISRVATDLIIDRYSLSPSLTVHESRESLFQRINHLLLEYRMEYLQERKRSILQQLSTTSDSDRLIALLTEQKDVQQLITQLAGKLGRV